MLEPTGPVHASKETALPLMSHVESDSELPTELCRT